MGTAASSALGRLGLPAPRLPAPSRPAWLGVAALGLGAVALGTVAWRRARSRRRRRLQQVGTVAQLWIYPVKSCKGVPVSAAECTALGLRSGHLRDRTWGNLGPRSLPLKERTKAERRILRTAVAAEASRSWERASARAPSPHSRKPPCVDGETESRAPQRGNPDPCFLPHAGAAWRGLLLRPGLGSRDPRECLGFREGGRGPERAALFSSGSGVRPARSLIVRLCFELFPPTRALTAPAGNTEGRGAEVFPPCSSRHRATHSIVRGELCLCFRKAAKSPRYFMVCTESLTRQDGRIYRIRFVGPRGKGPYHFTVWTGTIY
ncbi:mitochondrial amidoxime-reducing component 1 isoform X4 [Ursus arctos]|uniref:mitochondrial amidoxime-reducing component 1 isoform X4 n=1 Tax=Ursus arctos TaxID=9644 RepID=UPI002017A16A|nr:mitochondrial amidoxime-reducing component 1 isoform X4 [Ursus arctos]